MCSEPGADKRLFYYQLASGATGPPRLHYNSRLPMVPDGYYYALALAGAAALVGWLAGPLWALPACLLALFFLWFFRDPERVIPDYAGAVVSPADGKVTDVSSVLMNGVPRTRISIFLSVFDVHVNRSPLAGVIREVRYQKGKFLNAMNPASAEHNEQNAVTVEGDGQTVVFKQIAGLLARRIVFNKKVGDRVGRGERVGLIKFGSRVDVLLDPSAALQIKVGDRVKGGSSVLARLERVTRAADHSRSDSARSAVMDPEVPQILAPRKRQPPRRLSKGMYILPSLFTTANIAFGYYAILQITHATVADAWHFDNAAKAIGFAVMFDGLDGRIARMTGTSSDFGRELDSLADVVTFGVAPALLAWTWGFRQLPTNLGDLSTKLVQFGAIASFLFLMAGASRLARFNISQQPAAFESWPSGQEVFCRDADSGGRRCDRRGRAFFQRRSHCLLVDRADLDVDGGGGRLSDGQHLALLQLQGH